MLHLIDKTAVLEQAVRNFPALYLEGAAASGKSTAVQMMQKKHPETKYRVFWMDREAVRLEALENLKLLPKQDSQAEYWFIFENIPREISKELAQGLADFVREMPEHWRTIFISREQPPEAFLDLIWKRRMEIIPQRELLFSQNEVEEMVEYAQSPLQPKELYRATGGWAGCVDMMIRLAGKKYFQPESSNKRTDTGWDFAPITAPELRRQYEIDTYIQKEILDTLSEPEQRIVRLGALAPWINEDICGEVCGLIKENICGGVHGSVNEDIGSPGAAQELLKGLERKGMLIWNQQKNYWKTAPMFSGSEGQPFQDNESKVSDGGSRRISREAEISAAEEADIRMLEGWYESHGYLKEALWCCRQYADEKEYCACLIRHYEKIPFLGLSYTEILDCEDPSPEAAYLRGMCHRASGNFHKMSREEEAIGSGYPEIYLNLMFADPELSLDEWLELAVKLSKEQGQRKFHLFEILGYSHTYLCGLRDLSDLFACTKREENRKAHLWKDIFGEPEWRAYCLARINYYMETDRKKVLQKDDIELLSQITQSAFLQKIRTAGTKGYCKGQEWKDGIAGLYLYCLMQTMQPDEELRNKIFSLADALCRTENPVCIQTTEAVMGIFAYTLDNQENLGHWLLTDKNREESNLTYTELIFRVRGYLMLHQYGKAGRLLQKNMSYLKMYRMTSLYAEVLFQQAVVNWHMEQHGQALQNAIESFLINGSCRYVGFYTIYGNAGVEVLEAYIEWMQKNIPGGWKRKKKYNYGNVLRMPVEDYLDVILRKAKRIARKERAPGVPEQSESLTMMETIVLQAVCQGLSNAEIGEQQNLKITTVKSHIYSMYKKLGVKNRMQAALKGKEMGIV